MLNSRENYVPVTLTYDEMWFIQHYMLGGCEFRNRCYEVLHKYFKNIAMSPEEIDEFCSKFYMTGKDAYIDDSMEPVYRGLYFQPEFNPKQEIKTV